MHKTQTDCQSPCVPSMYSDVLHFRQAYRHISSLKHTLFLLCGEEKAFMTLVQKDSIFSSTSESQKKKTARARMLIFLFWWATDTWVRTRTACSKESREMRCRFSEMLRKLRITLSRFSHNIRIPKIEVTSCHWQNLYNILNLTHVFMHLGKPTLPKPSYQLILSYF